MNDPIVEEVRKAGQAYIDSFRGNMRAVCDDLRRRTEDARRSGRQVVSMPHPSPRQQYDTTQQVRGE